MEDEVGRKLIHYATMKGCPEIIEFLCGKGIDLD